MKMQPITYAGLCYWYGRINRDGFGGRLPKIHLEFSRSLYWLGCSYKRPRLKGGFGFRISINKRIQFSRTLVINTLVHEMVHIEHWSWEHSPRFRHRIYQVIAKAKLKRFL